MHLSLFSNTHSLCWTGATKAMATGPGGAMVLAGLFFFLVPWPGFSSLPGPPRSLAFARGYRCRARTTQWRARVVVSRSLAETARVTITTGFTCVSTLQEAGARRPFVQPSRGARDRSCTAAVQGQLLPVAQDRQSFVHLQNNAVSLLFSVDASVRMAVNSLLATSTTRILAASVTS